MTTLFNLLISEILKIEFLAKTELYANNTFKLALERKNWIEADWCKYFNIEPRPVNVGTSMEFLSFPKGFYNTRQSREYDKLRNLYGKIVLMGLEEFVKLELIKAEEHYVFSIKKLAERILKKQLNLDNLTLNTSKIGVNIETIISDGIKTVKAFTIVASGEIQRPHYRYLVN